MPNNKKNSFIVYNDNQEVFTELSDEDAGKLIKAMIEYSSTGTQIEMCPMLKLAFIPIRQQMDRNMDKYENICERNRKNGMLGGRPRNPNNPVGILVTQNNPEKPKKPDTDTDTDTDKDKDTKKNIYSSLNCLTETVCNEVADEYSVSRAITKNLAEEIRLYCESKGKRYSNYKATLQTWLRKRIQERPDLKISQGSHTMYEALTGGLSD